MKDTTSIASKTTQKCVICAKAAQPETFPFCSQKCRAVDLNRWLSGAYVLPATEEEDEEALK